MSTIVNQINKLTFFLICVLALGNLSCTHEENVPSYCEALDSIKQEVLSNPKRVVASYDSMMNVIGTSSDRVSRELQLYLLLAKKINDEPSKNDSLGKILVREFASSPPILKSLSLYIRAMGHVELGATEIALQELYKAKDTPGIQAYTRQYVRVCLAISEIYVDKGMYSLALTLKYEALKYTKRAKDYEYLSHSYRDIANIYEMMSKIDSSSICFQKAFYYGALSGSKYAVYCLNIDYARFLLLHDSLSKGKQVMSTILVPHKKSILLPYYALKIRCLYLEENYDSCVYYCDLMQRDSDPAGRLTAYGYSYKCGLKTKNNSAALEALEQYTALCDSLFDIHKVEDIRATRNKYDFLLGEKEKEVVEKRFVLTVSSIVIVALLVVFILYSLIQQQRLRNIKRLEIMQARLKLRHIQYERSTQSLQDKKQEVEDLKRQLNNMVNKESSSGRELTKLRKRLAELTVRLKSIEMTSSQLEEKSFKESPAYQKIVHAITFQKYADLTIEDWTAFQEGCQVAFPTLYAAVSGFSFSMKTVELKICYLTKLGIAPTEISRLVFKSPSAVSKCKTRIYAKLMNCHGRTADFDELMLSL